MAVGWWAKSSITVMPLITARTSRRRLTLLKVAIASAIAAVGMPAAAARAAAAVAFRALCSPAQIHIEMGPGEARAENFPVHAAGFIAEILNAPVCGISESIPLDRAERVAHTLGHVGAAFVGNNESAARDEIDEALEGGLDGFEVGVNVGVVKLDVRQDERGGKVVEEFGPLSKKAVSYSSPSTMKLRVGRS